MLLIISISLYILVFGLGYKKAHYQILLNDSQKQNLAFGLMVGLCVLWSIQTGIHEQLPVHFLGLTVTYLLLGHHLALLIALVAYVMSQLYVGISWLIIGQSLLPNIVVPLLMSHLIYVWAYHHLPRHFFVYTFICGFLAGAVSIASLMLSKAGLLWLAGQFNFSELLENYLILTPLLLVPEAMLNGMLITIAVAYFPNWVRSFSDEDYLNK
ncbi:energy-coupling factor ABC transporter permease [Algibacillus agarilyticus]|uniref:energy-coupling factor ABC transporter permease n=1 Tax=Algibacillus agarilyticus TaxID=2234133 RepID=UPI000DD02463|nr:energy-coupling factor ABC transporter permease [Algibacillus agarilyticus]